MNFSELMRALERSGQRLSNLEHSVGLIRTRLRFWQLTALISGGLALVLFLAWRGCHQRLERCECEKRQ